jgi:hypothetical protein
MLIALIIFINICRILVTIDSAIFIYLMTESLLDQEIHQLMTYNLIRDIWIKLRQIIKFSQ